MTSFLRLIIAMNVGTGEIYVTATADVILAKVRIVQENIKKLVDNNGKYCKGQPDPLDAVTPVPLEVVVLTSAQGVWHTERGPRGPGQSGGWTSFGDVEATTAGTIGNISSRPRNVAL
jgi:hypothetical protein